MPATARSDLEVVGRRERDRLLNVGLRRDRHHRCRVGVVVQRVEDLLARRELGAAGGQQDTAIDVRRQPIPAGSGGGVRRCPSRSEHRPGRQHSNGAAKKDLARNPIVGRTAAIRRHEPDSDPFRTRNPAAWHVSDHSVASINRKFARNGCGPITDISAPSRSRNA